MTAAVDLTEQRFGRLVAKKRGQPNYSRHTTWQCLCDCGNIAEVTTEQLRSGKTQSCGCIRKGHVYNPDGRPRKLSSTQILRNAFLSQYKSNCAKGRGLEWGLTDERFDELTQSNCHYCGAPPAERTRKIHKGVTSRLLFNGIDRKNSDLGYIEGNVVSCCKQCQYAKLDTPYEEFIAFIFRAADHLRGESQ